MKKYSKSIEVKGENIKELFDCPVVTDIKKATEAVDDGLDIEEGAEYYGCTWDKVSRKSDNKYGSLVSFPSCRVMNMNVVTHESSHVVDAFEKAMGMEHGGEASAYLMGWIASCINKARMGEGNFIKIKEGKK